MFEDDYIDATEWLQSELADEIDEGYELEISEPGLSMALRRIYKHKRPPSMDRQTYFRELLALQSELIKLQDWVEHSGAKIAILFEGRDAAGKGGVIKRITQRLNPRVCRVVALPRPTEKELSQWYFQRYVPPFAIGW